MQYRGATLMTNRSPLHILIVEDEAIVAMMLEDILDELGYSSQTAASVEDAHNALANGKFDRAILDVNLQGQTSTPIAEALIEMNIPFVFATGYGAKGIESQYRDRPILQKPFLRSNLQKILEQD